MFIKQSCCFFIISWPRPQHTWLALRLITNAASSPSSFSLPVFSCPALSGWRWHILQCCDIVLLPLSRQPHHLPCLLGCHVCSFLSIKFQFYLELPLEPSHLVFGPSWTVKLCFKSILRDFFSAGFSLQWHLKASHYIHIHIIRLFLYCPQLSLKTTCLALSL